MNAPCLVIPRIVTSSALHFSIPESWHDDQRYVCVELFLPHDPANPGMLACWDGCHNESSLGYYFDSKPPRTLAECDAADAAVRRYQSFMNSIPAEDRQPIVRRQRLPRDWRSIAWGRHR